MDYYVYILKSLSHDKWYIGSTKNLEERLQRLNSGRSTFTKKYMPWQIWYTEKYLTRSEAVKREYFLKSAKGFLELKKIKHSSNVYQKSEERIGF